MTFEEFFAKKKINLERFEKEAPDLLSTLRKEYEVMGPKSFDHSKKFLFNIWRRKYQG